MSNDEQVTAHPAFGQIQISRVSGQTVLHDSPLRHQHLIAVRVLRAEVVRDPNLHTSRSFPREQIVEAYMSEAQFAQAITTMNTMGTPCTLRHYRDPQTGELQRPKLEAPDQLRETFEGEMKAKLAKVAAKASEAEKVLKEALAQKTVKKADLKSLENHLFKLRQDLTDNLPFFQTMFTEAMEKVESRSKTEIVALADRLVQEKGLEALGVASDVRELTDAVPSEKDLERGDAEVLDATITEVGDG